MISTRILADSINPKRIRIISYLWKYPRFIHSEVMTHRVFSRNAASSRAVPLQVSIRRLTEEPAMPEWYGAEQKGMQSGERLNRHDQAYCEAKIYHLRDTAIQATNDMRQIGLHKSIANRYLEPWMHMEVIVTSTQWHNFFALRAHHAAMPEFQVLAYNALHDFLYHQPRQLEWGDWHVPRFNNMETQEPDIAVSTGRCARTSYLTQDGKYDLQADEELHDRLQKAGHWSPFEHCAQACEGIYPVSNFDRWDHDLQDIRYSGWRQYRKNFDNENRTAEDTDLLLIMANKPDWIQIYG